RGQTGNRTIISTRTVAEARTVPVESSKRHEHDIGVEHGGFRPRPGRTETSRHHFSAAYQFAKNNGLAVQHHRQAKPRTAVGEGRHKGSQVKLGTDWQKARDNGTWPEIQRGSAQFRNAQRSLYTQVGSQGIPPPECLLAQLPFQFLQRRHAIPARCRLSTAITIIAESTAQ